MPNSLYITKLYDCNEASSDALLIKPENQLIVFKELIIWFHDFKFNELSHNKLINLADRTLKRLESDETGVLHFFEKYL